MSQIRAGATLSYVILGLNALVGLLFTPYMLRVMGQSEYGLYSLVGSVVAYLSILDFGFGNAVIRYTAKFKSENRLTELRSMLGMFLLLNLIIGFLVLIIGAGLYANVENMFSQSMTIEEVAKAKILVIILVVNLFIGFALSTFSAIVNAYERFVFQKALQMIRIFSSTLVMVVFLSLGYMSIALAIIVTVFNLLYQLANAWYVLRKLKIRFSFKNFDYSLLKEIAIYSFFIFLNIIMDRIYWSTGQFVLGIYVGTSAVAIFSVAIQLQRLYMHFSTAISGVLLPRVTQLTATGGSREEVSELFIKTGRVQFVVMSFILSGFILFGKSFIILWAGSDYEEAYIITLLFFVPLMVPLIQNVGITILQARNDLKFRSVVYFFIAIASLLIQVMLVKQYGAIGVAFSVAIALFLGHIVIMNIYYYVKQGINIPKFWKEISSMAVVPVVLTVASHFVLQYFTFTSVFNLLVGIICFSLVYIPAVWLKGISDGERAIIKKPVQKILSKTRQ